MDDATFSGLIGSAVCRSCNCNTRAAISFASPEMVMFISSPRFLLFRLLVLRLHSGDTLSIANQKFSLCFRQGLKSSAKALHDSFLLCSFFSCHFIHSFRLAIISAGKPSPADAPKSVSAVYIRPSCRIANQKFSWVKSARKSISSQRPYSLSSTQCKSRQ